MLKLNKKPLPITVYAIILPMILIMFVMRSLKHLKKVLSSKGDSEQIHLYKTAKDYRISQLPVLAAAEHVSSAAKAAANIVHYHNPGAERVKALPGK